MVGSTEVQPFSRYLYPSIWHKECCQEVRGKWSCQICEILYRSNEFVEKGNIYLFTSNYWTHDTQIWGGKWELHVKIYGDWAYKYKIFYIQVIISNVSGSTDFRRTPCVSKGLQDPAWKEKEKVWWWGQKIAVGVWWVFLGGVERKALKQSPVFNFAKPVSWISFCWQQKSKRSWNQILKIVFKIIDTFHKWNIL